MDTPAQDPAFDFFQAAQFHDHLHGSVGQGLDLLGNVPLPFVDQLRGKRVKADTHGSEMQLQLIASGLGLGLVPRSVLTHSVWQRRLEVVKVARFAPQLDVWLLHPPHLGNLSRAVARLGDRMEASFKS